MLYEPIPRPGEPIVADGRRRRRAPTALVAEVRIGSAPWQRVQLINVSLTGFRIAWIPGATPGTVLRIRIPNLELLSAIVRWRRNEGVGCEFSSPLSLYVFEHLVGAAGG